MLDRPTAAIAANRFGLGARPGELAQIGSQPRDWLRAQLAGAPPLLTGSELRSSADTLARGLEVRRELRASATERRGVGEPESVIVCAERSMGKEMGKVFWTIFSRQGRLKTLAFLSKSFSPCFD